MRYVFIIISCFLFLVASTKDVGNLDSLEAVLGSIPENSYKADVYAELGFKYSFEDRKKAEDFVNRGILLCQKIEDNEMLSKNLSIKSFINYQQGNFELAMKSSFQALDLAKKYNYGRRLVYIYNDIGNIYVLKEQYHKAIEFYDQALKLALEHQINERIVTILSNLGETHKRLNNYNIALRYDYRALNHEHVKTNERKQNLLINNIGTIHYYLNDIDSAFYYLINSRDLGEKIGYTTVLCETYYFLGKIYNIKGNTKEAIISYNKSIKNCQLLNERLTLKFVYNDLSELYKEKGLLPQALEYKEKYIKLSEELEQTGQLSKIIAEYETAKKDQELKLVQREKELAEAEILTKKRTQYALGTIALLLGIFIVYGYSRFKIIRKQKGVIEIQRDSIQQKQKDFLNSLDYASAIQRSILPVEQRLNRAFDDHFVFYKPLHTVSGDFYYFMEKEDRIYISVADCTGHGVPGAFMSMIGYEILNYIINTMNVVEPNRIIARLNDRIYSTLKQDQGQGNDGMDLALACIYKGKNKMDVCCAGSNVMVFNKNRPDGELILKRNKYGVGSKFNRNVKYDQLTVDLEEGDVIYMGSDGYVDQFGGPRGKKYKMNQLKALLKDIHIKPAEEQGNIVADSYEKWKGKFEQIDDVTVLGFKPKVMAINNKKLNADQKQTINNTLTQLVEMNLELDISEAVELLDGIDINNEAWKEIYEELTDYVMSMDIENVKKRVAEILEEL